MFQDNPPLRRAALVALAALGLLAGPVAAQVETLDPDTAFDAPIDGDLKEDPGSPPVYSEPVAAPETVSTPAPAAAPAAAPGEVSNGDAAIAPEWSNPAPPDSASVPAANTTADAQTTTYREDDLIGAARGLFGEGAEGLAMMIKKVLADQGEPNAYIVGREASGAFVIGARYGSGTLFHKIEGQRPIYWTGPSIGIDAGANASSTFILVYNLYDTEEIYERYPAGEGQLYVVGGLTASYLRKGNIVLIPIRMGAGLRLGINAGYIKFSKEQEWFPF